MEQKPKVKRALAGEFYPRKLSKTGGTRMLSVGRVLPKDWQMVKLEVVKLEGDECILKLVRLI